MASQLDIVNEALSIIGEMPIDDIDDTGDPKAVKVKAIWEVTRDQILEMRPWSFALTRAQLEKDAIGPVYGFEYAYVLPADCLRVVSVSAYDYAALNTWSLGDTAYSLEGGRVLSDNSPLYLLYVRRVIEPGRFPPSVASALSAMLAFNMAAFFTKSATTAQAALKVFEMRMILAVKSDAAQQGFVESSTRSPWSEARN